MLGVSPEVEKVFGRDQLTRILARGATGTGRYDRGNGDVTAPLPLRLHLSYAARGWVLVRVCSRGGLAIVEGNDVV